MLRLFDVIFRDRGAHDLAMVAVTGFGFCGFDTSQESSASCMHQTACTFLCIAYSSENQRRWSCDEQQLSARLRLFLTSGITSRFALQTCLVYRFATHVFSSSQQCKLRLFSGPLQLSGMCSWYFQAHSHDDSEGAACLICWPPKTW